MENKKIGRLDSLGRIVIPSEMRRSHELSAQSDIEFLVDGEQVVLRRHTGVCTFCGSSKDVEVYRDKNICRACMEEIKASIPV